MKIYTRRGDGGKTVLFGGKRVSKSNPRIEAIGTVDELNSAIGVVSAQAQSHNPQLKSELKKIQEDLFEIGAMLGKLENRNEKLKIKRLGKRVEELEKIIDKLTEKLPEIHQFVLPGGGTVGAFLHLTRAICRRAERRIVGLSEKEKIDKNILKYFNRLSDLLFTMERFVNYQEKQKEIVWIKN